MSMLDAFFSKGGAFRGAKCKTLLKLTIPRIKLLRNRREIQLKQMRRDIANLLEAGQEATARIRVEHIIREENMMAAQEILELFCELIVVRLPIIEAQRECPLDLKEAISSLCFAAPRCADLPELQQVQVMFATKYGKEFVAAATELMPDCGVNRQLIELLSIRPPPVEAKMKLLKEIAEEHEVEWDPSATESEFLKPHEDLLNGPTYFNGSTLPLPKEKHDEALTSNAVGQSHEEHESDTGFESLDLPEVPKVSVRPASDIPSAPAIGPHAPDSPSIDAEHTYGFSNPTHLEENPTADAFVKAEMNNSQTPSYAQTSVPVVTGEKRQFIPFVSPTPFPSASVEENEPVPMPPASFSSVKSTEPEITSKNEQAIPTPTLQSDYMPSKQTGQISSISRNESIANDDLQDVLSAAQTAAETAERAASAARAAANLAQLRIADLKKNTQVSQRDDDDVRKETHHQTDVDKPNFDHQDSFSNEKHENEQTSHVPRRLPSLEDDPYFSYPNLFTSKVSETGSGFHSGGNN